jgi:hypothetical protein
MPNGVPWHLLFFFFFYGVFVRFSTRGVKNTIRNFGENPCQKLLAEKVERKKTFVFSLRFF